MVKNLVIVESPAKAKTIAGYLGKDFRVESSYGHIRDLPKKNIGVDIKGGFIPTYEISPDKKKIVSNLKKSAKGATIWLASDGDREGEAIAWHVSHAIGVNPSQANRIVFHEITKPAIEAAVVKPRKIDMKLVEAQQARRVLDRLVGYELSPVLWRKVRSGLSAGRVQSVAVRLIVEREREIKDFKSASTFKVTADFAGPPGFNAELDRRLSDADKAKAWLRSVQKSTYTIAEVNEKPRNRSPSAPFTTSTLQQEAGRRLGYSVRQTMTIAQKLYESGLITYMRTDSMNLSPIAINAISEYVVKNFGERYSLARQFKTKNRNAQEAHEAIRPTNINKITLTGDKGQSKLYELIWKRTVASQMAPAKVEATEVIIDITNHPEKFVAQGETMVFPGFLKVYGGGKDDKLLPKLKEGQIVKLERILAAQIFSRPPARYSEPSLVKKLEELGIGRPSTYAPTISTIQDRGYVEKKDLDGEHRKALYITLESGKISDEIRDELAGADKNKLLPTGLADIVTDFLVKYFNAIVDYGFTAKAEDELDAIADGKLKWNKMLDNFYNDFHPLIAKSDKATRAEVSQARKLGKDPSTGLPVFARFGRYGPVLQLGEANPDKENGKNDANKLAPRFAPMPEGLAIEDVTLKDALPMFQLPREVGKTSDGEIMTADIGRYGPYVRVGKLFVSIKGEDPMTISQAEARKLVSAKLKDLKERVIADYGTIKVLRGPYGPYVTDGKRNAKIPKEKKPEDISEKVAKNLLDTAPSKYRRFTKQSS